MWWTWLAGILDWIREWRADRARRAKEADDRRSAREAKEDARRDSDNAQYRLSVEHAAGVQRKLIDELVERVTNLEAEQKATNREMMRIQVKHARCEAVAEAQAKEIIALKRQVEALTAKDRAP